MLNVAGQQLRGAIVTAGGVRVWHSDGVRAARELAKRAADTGLVCALGDLATLDRLRLERRRGRAVRISRNGESWTVWKSRACGREMKGKGFVGETCEPDL